LLAVPLATLATLVTGLLIYIGIVHTLFILDLLTCAILSSIDPVAVISLFKKLDAPKIPKPLSKFQNPLLSVTMNDHMMGITI